MPRAVGPGSEPEIEITGAEWVDLDIIEDPDKTPVMPLEYEPDTLSKILIEEAPKRER
jgi:hypothetical protein